MTEILTPGHGMGHRDAQARPFLGFRLQRSLPKSGDRPPTLADIQKLK
jgi:hypothetical protein